MINFKRLVIAGVAAACFTTFSFAQEVSFENKLQWGVVDLGISEGNTETNLSAVNNESNFEYTSENLDAGLALKFSASKSEGVFSFGSEGYIDDAFIEYRPIEMFGIGLHKGYPVAGSYLPCLEKEIDAANIGSDLGVFVRPIEGLTVAAGLDFISMFGSDESKPLFNFGAEYALGEMLTFGAAFRDVASDERTLGAYASYTGIEGLTVNAGFTYNGALEDYNVTGNFLNAAVMFNKDALGIYANAVFSVGGEADADNELYSAANISYMFGNAFFANIYGGFSADFDNDDAWAAEIFPGAGYSIDEHNTVGAGVFVCLMKGYTNISFPVYWKFNY